MENGLPKKDRFEVKARIFLSVNTLRVWIDLVKSGKEREAAESQCLEDERKALEKKLYSAVLAGKVKKEADSAAILELKKADARKILMSLKEQKLIEYSRKRRCWARAEFNDMWDRNSDE